MIASTIEDPRPLRTWTADEFEHLVAIGVIGEDERVELLDGRIHTMSAKGPIHATSVGNLDDALRAAYGAGFVVRKEESIRISSSSIPEPDLAVFRGSRVQWALRHPTGPEALLVVEVAVSTLQTDLVKAPRYAQGGIPEYWLVDVENMRVLVHDQPSNDGYGRVVECREDDEIAVPGTATRLRARDLLP